MFDDLLDGKRMSLKAAPQTPKKSKRRTPAKKPRSENSTPARWRDVRTYFSTLDAETRGLTMLANSVRKHLKPTNVFERIWCDDIIALSWQAHQLRQLKEYVVFEGARDVVAERLKIANRQDTLKQLDNEATYNLSAAMYVLGGPLTRELSDKISDTGMLTDRRFQMGYVARTAELENVDRLIFANEKRRDELIDRFQNIRAK